MIPEMVVKNDLLPKGIPPCPVPWRQSQRDIGIAWKENGLRHDDITMVAQILDKLISGADSVTYC